MRRLRDDDYSPERRAPDFSEPHTPHKYLTNIHEPLAPWSAVQGVVNSILEATLDDDLEDNLHNI